MAWKQCSRYCRTCGRKTLHGKQVFGGGWGCLLTILTGGLFLPVWLLLDVAGVMGRWRCQVCGR